MKHLLIISSILTVALSQQPILSCSYFLIGDSYACDLTINNPNGLNNFTGIEGTHFEGFTNVDTELLYSSRGSVSTNVPSVICETFPNLIRIQLYNIGLTEISDTAFTGCSSLTELVLSSNRISSITANAFVELVAITTINLNDNALTTLPENVFADQKNLSTLDLSLNQFESIPASLFQPLENLQTLYLRYANLSVINNQWFTSNVRLNSLNLASNRISVSEDSFNGLEGLRILNLDYNAISEIPSHAFEPLRHLQHLFLIGNTVSELQENSFSKLESLEILDIGENPISAIADGAFRGLDNLNVLSMSNCRLQQLNSTTFEHLRNLTFISLNFNQIEALPQNIFVHLPNISYLGLWNNRLKTLRRNSFGSLSNLQTIDLEANVLNGLDRAIIDDAVSLDSMYFSGNLCADSYFGNFVMSRAQHLLALERCFSNIRYIIDVITEGDADYSFFDGLYPGIALRVRTDNEVQISLTPFNFMWNPTIEIVIGSMNNTKSLIRVNQETVVAIVPTPNIVARDQWNDFRVTWANQVILVYSGNNNLPFMGYTMQDFVPVNFYGLRAVHSRATWSVQPFGW
ncbi:hypothetical protein HA402_014907 [Bradysia odoriphaga]|nr:hypothetical protein HA402_014907 [Bradysia odoriphaga]